VCKSYKEKEKIKGIYIAGMCILVEQGSKQRLGLS